MSSLQIQSKASTISDNTHWEKLNALINEYATYLTASVITLQIHLKAVLCEATEKFKQCREIYTRDAFVQAARASFCESLINAQDLALLTGGYLGKVVGWVVLLQHAGV